MELRILSGGAAQGVVGALQQSFAADTGAVIQGTFGAVGAMKAKLLAGAPCDAVILTAALIEELTRSGHLLAGSAAPLGRVRTGIAVRAGEPLPMIADRDSLRASLTQARGIYFPDPDRATAGIHFVNVLKQLGIHDEVLPRLRPFPNGATAMRALAQSAEAKQIGCTQITEIKYTEGVTLVGPLPKEFELATVYSAAVCSGSAQPETAAALIELLSGARSAALRSAGGFEF
ncbi:MAG TPA: substrate-binding domain-containing protein [Rhodocyclaceae bacterium]|nr:substrate-binding domain-containing protein [Rhodocyclaceae bacterium]HUY03237.1 substrate-binding domain-containing protein [Rhodocyclaceae bacterium]